MINKTNATRRSVFKIATAAVAGASLSACATGKAASAQQKPAFLLVHGAWHGAWTYQNVIPELVAMGHAAVAVDLPGHGLDAKFPLSYYQRPLDQKLFSTEISPVASVTVDQCAAAVIAALDRLREGGYTKVVLVGHSLGGVTITKVAESVPDKLFKVVYLTAFMLGAGQRSLDANAMPESQTALVRPLVKSNPLAIGATRIDFASSDPIFQAAAKSAFYGDLTDDQFLAAAHLLTPDEPLALSSTPTEKTEERWGSVERHYIKCLKDRAIPVALQQRFIDQADQFAPRNKTVVHTMDTSHSPFFSAPKQLGGLLAQIANS